MFVVERVAGTATDGMEKRAMYRAIYQPERDQNYILSMPDEILLHIAAALPEDDFRAMLFCCEELGIGLKQYLKGRPLPQPSPAHIMSTLEQVTWARATMWAWPVETKGRNEWRDGARSLDASTTTTLYPATCNPRNDSSLMGTSALVAGNKVFSLRHDGGESPHIRTVSRVGGGEYPICIVRQPYEGQNRGNVAGDQIIYM